MIAWLEAKRAGLVTRAHLPRNFAAGLVVGVVALPLAMAFAIASGATPAQGLYTAIVAGVATSLLGGTRVQISGPTGAFIAVLAGITATHGIAGLQIATLMAGAMLLLMGIARLGTVIKFIPSPVIVGFTAGIAVIIWVSQWKDFFGLRLTAGGAHFHEKLVDCLGAHARRQQIGGASRAHGEKGDGEVISARAAVHVPARGWQRTGERRNVAREFGARHGDTGAPGRWGVGGRSDVTGLAHVPLLAARGRLVRRGAASGGA